MIITDTPGMFTVHNFSACSFAYANSDKGAVLNQLDRHLFSKIVVMQSMNYDTGESVEGNFLDKGYRLKTLYEIQNTASSFRRYSECESKDAPKGQFRS